jgi:molybdopterin/thiamine biosynthesis adenylyltransferase
LLADNDVVDETNLHRQILFSEPDIGRDKARAAADKLIERGVNPQRIALVGERLVPENACELVRAVDLVVEGADNYATKFLAADAARIEQRPIVHGAAVGWTATTWSVARQGGPCYRCLFEDLPSGIAQNCASVGVMGPVVGFAAALMAEAALECLFGQPRYGTLLCYDGLRDRMRRVEVHPRSTCPLCGPCPSITHIDSTRYVEESCSGAAA